MVERPILHKAHECCMDLETIVLVPINHVLTPNTHYVFYCDFSKATCSLPLQDMQAKCHHSNSFLLNVQNCIHYALCNRIGSKGMGGVFDLPTQVTINIFNCKTFLDLHRC